VIEFSESDSFFLVRQNGDRRHSRLNAFLVSTLLTVSSRRRCYDAFCVKAAKEIRTFCRLVTPAEERFAA
jgi:hypothetical protein